MTTGIRSKPSGGGGIGGNSSGSSRRSNTTVTNTHHSLMTGFHLLNIIDPFLIDANICNDSLCSTFEFDAYKFVFVESSSSSSDEFLSFHDVDLVYEFDA